MAGSSDIAVCCCCSKACLALVGLARGGELLQVCKRCHQLEEIRGWLQGGSLVGDAEELISDFVEQLYTLTKRAVEEPAASKSSSAR